MGQRHNMSQHRVLANIINVIICNDFITLLHNNIGMNLKIIRIFYLLALKIQKHSYLTSLISSIKCSIYCKEGEIN